MTWKLYALLSGGAAVATYLMSPAIIAPVRQQPQPAVRKAAAQMSDVDMQALADHLQSRVRSEIQYHDPKRNPFAFGYAPRAESKQVIAPKPIEPPAAVFVPPPPPVGLSGVAADRVDGVWTRTAIFNSPNGVLLAREGETVGGSYRVVSIGESSVTLESTNDGSKTTLSLTRP